MSKDNQDEVSNRDVIKKIGAGEINPKTLDKEARLACVETLIIEGHQQPAIAQFLKKSDRTIRRDIEEIRNGYGIKRNANFTNSIVAEFMFNARVNIAHLSRLARSSGSIAEKSRAEAMAFKVNKEVMQELDYWGVLDFTPDKKIINDNLEAKEKPPLTQRQKEIMECSDPLSSMEKMILAERIARAMKGTVQRSRFSSDDPNGQKILDSLVEKGVLEVVNLTTVRLKINAGEPIIRPQEMAGSNFDIIWSVLITPYEEELNESSETKQEQGSSEIKQT